MDNNDTILPQEPAQTSRFSWHRIAELARYHRPMIEKQTLVYLIVSVIFAIVTLLPLKALAQIGLFSLIWSIIPLMFELAPCILAKSGDPRIVERLIPASAAEKLTFRLLYFLILVPAALYILPFISTLLYPSIPAIQTPEFTEIIEMMHTRSFQLSIINILTTLGCTLTCLYVVSYARTNRVLKGIISVLASQFLIALIGAFWGIHSVFMTGVSDGIQGKSRNSDELQEYIREFMVDSPFLYFTAGLLLVWVITMLILNYRVLKYRNL